MPDQFDNPRRPSDPHFNPEPRRPEPQPPKPPDPPKKSETNEQRIARESGRPSGNA